MNKQARAGGSAAGAQVQGLFSSVHMIAFPFSHPSTTRAATNCADTGACQIGRRAIEHKRIMSN